MIYLDDSPKLQRYLNDHKVDRSTIDETRFHKSQRYLLIGTITEKHGTLWKFSRLLKIIFLAFPSFCSKKIKENFSISLSEFKSGKSRVSVYALEKLLNKKPLGTENQPEQKANLSEPPIKSATAEEIDASKLQDKKSIGELIDGIGQLPDLEERKIKLGRVFLKLQPSQIIEYLESYESQTKQVAAEFESKKKTFSEMKKLLDGYKLNMECSSKSFTFPFDDDLWQLTRLNGNNMKEKYGRILTDEDIQVAQSSLKVYEDLYAARENAYINVILGCQSLDEKASNECLSYLFKIVTGFDKISHHLNPEQSAYFSRFKAEKESNS